MNQNPRPQTPAPPTLLWAHEIRRENIYLSNQLDSTRASLTTTTTTTHTLQQTVSELHSLVQNLVTENQRLAEKVDRVVDESARRTETETQFESEVEARVGGVVGRLNERVGVLERENEDLRERVDGMGREVGEIVGDVKMEVLGAIRGMMGRLERRGLMDPAKDMNVQTKSPDLIPDSMPVDNGIQNTASKPDRSVRGSSETTFGDPIQEDEPNPNSPTRDTYLFSNLKQDGRTLADYLSLSEGIRDGLSPRKREGLIVERFLDGLADGAVRRMLEERLDQAGWGWDVMRDCFLGLIEQQQKIQVTSANCGKVKRKKRCIPIEPASDGSVPVLAGMY